MCAWHSSSKLRECEQQEQRAADRRQRGGREAGGDARSPTMQGKLREGRT